MPDTVTRYALTVRDEHGRLVLADSNDGRNFYDTEDAARRALKATIENNSPERIAQLGGGDTLDFAPITCWANTGDAVATILDENEILPWAPAEAKQHRASALQSLTVHGHSWTWSGRTRAEKRDDENLTRANCEACVLNGYRDRDDNEHAPSEGPNHAGWHRIYTEARMHVPEKWHAAFARALDDEKAPEYARALRRSIATFGDPR